MLKTNKWNEMKWYIYIVYIYIYIYIRIHIKYIGDKRKTSNKLSKLASATELMRSFQFFSDACEIENITKSTNRSHTSQSVHLNRVQNHVQSILDRIWPPSSISQFRWTRARVTEDVGYTRSGERYTAKRDSGRCDESTAGTLTLTNCI